MTASEPERPALPTGPAPAGAASPHLARTIAECRAACAQLRQQTGRIGLIPTMGALHEGHLSLVRAARQECQHTVVTIFVNPSQFGPHEDFARYPRTIEADLAMLASEQTDWVFLPQPDAIYPPDYSTWVEPPHVALPLEGVCRPGHFRGVATIVLKLFQLVPADVAYFGQKDFQQCRVIEQMVADLNVPITIRRCPIVREPDGLAMSSRNRYLTAGERQQAVAISRSLRRGEQQIAAGERRAEPIRAAMLDELHAAGIERIDYVAVADPRTLTDLDVIHGPVALLIAAMVGSTRLIDNCLIE